MEYTLSLALADFFSVLFAGIGFLYIVRFISMILPIQRWTALSGSILVVMGGLSRALWKLIMALSGGEMDVQWLEDLLFVFMSPGYILLAWSVWQAVRAAKGKRIFRAWLLPFGIIVLMFAASIYLFRLDPASPAWERVLLSMMVLATVVTGCLLIAFAIQFKLTLAGILFLVNLLGIFVLNGMARLAEQPISMQWIEETINAASWLAFAFGARMIYQYARLNFDADDSAAKQKRSPVE